MAGDGKITEQLALVLAAALLQPAAQGRPIIPGVSNTDVAVSILFSHADASGLLCGLLILRNVQLLIASAAGSVLQPSFTVQMTQALWLAILQVHTARTFLTQCNFIWPRNGAFGRTASALTSSAPLFPDLVCEYTIGSHPMYQSLAPLCCTVQKCAKDVLLQSFPSSNC